MSINGTVLFVIGEAEDSVQKTAWYEEQEKVPSSLTMSDEMKAIATANMSTISDDIELPF